MFLADSNLVFKHFLAENALVTVTNVIFLPADKSDFSILVLLDWSSGFVTVDYGILLHRLETCVNIKDSTLSFLHSYLPNKKCFVALCNFTSSTAQLDSGVPQGSVPGPLLLSIYMLALSHILHNNDAHFHFYTDNTQLSMSVKSSDPKTLTVLTTYISDTRP